MEGARPCDGDSLDTGLMKDVADSEEGEGGVGGIITGLFRGGTLNEPGSAGVGGAGLDAPSLKPLADGGSSVSFSAFSAASLDSSGGCPLPLL